MRLLAMLAVAALGLTSMAPLQAATIKPEAAVAYRQGLYKAILWNFGPMGQMVQGKVPWNGAEFAARAQAVAFYSTQLLQGFPPGSLTAHSEAKAQIWQDWPDFSAHMQRFEQAAAVLARSAQSGDEAASKSAFKDTAATCKACHDRYRKE